jgi:hypothetical protein
MNTAFLNHVVGTAVCVALAYGINHYQRPSFEPSYAAQVYTEPQGSLQLNSRGRTLTFPLMLSQAVAYDVKRMGREHKLRELALRSAGPSDQPAKLELYVDLSRQAADMLPGAGDPSSLAQVELPVARSGRFGTRPSYVVSDDGQTRKVISGNLMLTGVMQTGTPAPARYRAEGRVELQLEGPSGVELITGRLEGLIAWDPVEPSR